MTLILEDEECGHECGQVMRYSSRDRTDNSQLSKPNPFSAPAGATSDGDDENRDDSDDLSDTDTDTEDEPDSDYGPTRV